MNKIKAIAEEAAARVILMGVLVVLGLWALVDPEEVFKRIG